MPNHVTTRCYVTSDDVDELSQFMSTFMTCDENSLFDFNNIIPMPEILRNSSSDSNSEMGFCLIKLCANNSSPFDSGGLFDIQVQRIRQELGMFHESMSKVARAYLEKHPEIKEAGLKYYQAIIETGFTTWYPWAIQNWGTKWNSYGFKLVKENPLEFVFETAWSFPLPIFVKLSEMFPTLTFECYCFDEGWNFAGHGKFHNLVNDFESIDATAEIYEKVYGEKYEEEEEEEEDED